MYVGEGNLWTLCYQYIIVITIVITIIWLVLSHTPNMQYVMYIAGGDINDDLYLHHCAEPNTIGSHDNGVQTYDIAYSSIETEAEYKSELVPTKDLPSRARYVLPILGI